MTLSTPPLPQTWNYQQFQVWWQQQLSSIQSELGALEAAQEFMADLAPITITADYTGVVSPSAQLPKSIAAKRYNGATDVTAECEWFQRRLQSSRRAPVARRRRASRCLFDRFRPAELCFAVFRRRIYPARGSGGFLRSAFPVHARGAALLLSRRCELEWTICSRGPTACKSRPSCRTTTRQAKALWLKGGGKDWFRRESTLRPRNAGAHRHRYWITRTPELEKDGERFHDTLEAAKKANGSSLPIHAHDPIHERYVGAAYRMFAHGQSVKAWAVYNRWAANSGYAQIGLVSQDPPVVDAVDAVVRLNGKELEVVECR
jgi:hypothetical protein